MKKVFGDSWGYRTEHVLRHVLLALMEIRGATLLDAVAMLVDEAQRHQILRQVHDPIVLGFWGHEFASYGKAFLAEILAAPLNKLSALFVSTFTTALLTKRRRVIDARQVLDRHRILLASLPKGRMGEEPSVLVGCLLLGVFAQAAMSRADVAELRLGECINDHLLTPPHAYRWIAHDVRRPFQENPMIAFRSASNLPRLDKRSLGATLFQR